MRGVLRNPAVLSVSLGHMAVDIFSSALPVLLVVFAANLGLSNVGLGTIITIYILTASLTQPIFGLVADRWDTRWVGIGALLWMAAGFVLAGMLPGYAALVAFVVAALGSGAYHPQGMLNVRRAAGARAASGTSLFFFFGQAGHAIGPLLAGFLLVWISLFGTTLVLAALAAPIVLLLARFAPRAGLSSASSSHSDGEEVHQVTWAPLTLIVFVLVVFFASWPQAATNAFLPKWLADAGFSSSAFGGLLAVFMVGSAFGNIFGGWLADRWSRKNVVVLALALSPFPFYTLYSVPSVGLGAIIAITLAGFAIGMPHSVIMIMGQNLFPRRMGLGSGLVLGFVFSVTALAAWFTGWLGDQIGLHQALLLVPWICVIAAIGALALPRTRRRSVAVEARRPVSDTADVYSSARR